jgi:2-polyprenyl-6-methoxyphenol hydroxylase-like FAD-dependent oxidoreductase
MKVGSGSDIYRAVKAVLERVPTLKADARPESLRRVAKQLMRQGVADAAIVANADAATLLKVRLDVLEDFGDAKKVQGGASLSGDTHTPKAERPMVLVSGGSYTGMLAAMQAVKSGMDVVLVEPRPNHTRDIRLATRQGMLDTLALLDPKLADEFLETATRFDDEALRLKKLPKDKPELTTVQRQHFTGADAAKASKTGAEMMASEYTHTIIAREFEGLVDKYVKENFGDHIQLVNDGKLHAVKKDDGSMTFDLEKPPAQKGDPPVYEDFLKGRKPSMVIVAEGSGSTTRTAMDIAFKETTPVQYWTAGVINTTDPQVKNAGDATLRVLYDRTSGTPQRAVAISDGHEGTWVLTQMAPGFAPDPKRPQSEINDHYFQRAALVTGHDEADLRKAGAAGPIQMPNSQPTAFPLQGKAAQEAARVLPDGTVVALLGDAVQTSTFQAGGGMNTAVNEMLPLMTLMEDLQSGVSAKDAAAKYQEAVFERGSAWSAKGIPYFFERTTVRKTRALIDLQLKVIADWRKEGNKDGPSPLERMMKILEEAKMATEPMGMRLAA